MFAYENAKLIYEGELDILSHVGGKLNVFIHNE